MQVSRKRLKDKAWVTKGLKISIKTNHRLYRSTLRETDPRHIIKYKTYKNELRKCLKAAEEKYYHQLFDDTKNSAYNLRKNLGPVINHKKIKRNQRISKLYCDGSYDTDSVSISNFINDYFSSIGKKSSTTHTYYKKQIIPHICQILQKIHSCPRLVSRK